MQRGVSMIYNATPKAVNSSPCSGGRGCIHRCPVAHVCLLWEWVYFEWSSYCDIATSICIPFCSLCPCPPTAKCTHCPVFPVVFISIHSPPFSLFPISLFPLFQSPHSFPPYSNPLFPYSNLSFPSAIFVIVIWLLCPWFLYIMFVM